MYSVKRDALKVLLPLVGIPLALAVIILQHFDIIKVYSDGDLTNAFGFFIEIGVAVFISVLLFNQTRNKMK